MNDCGLRILDLIKQKKKKKKKRTFIPQSANPNPQSAFVAVDELTKTYESGKNRVVVFRDLSLRIDKGEMIAIVGPSGAGKSTLLHLLGGLDRPTFGTVKVAEFY